MKGKEFEALKKLIKKAAENPASITADDARDGILLMKLAKLDETLKIFENVLRNEAHGQKYTDTSSLGTVVVGEPFKQAVNEKEFKTDLPQRYKEIIDGKIPSLHVNVSDLSAEEKKKYIHYEKATAKITFKLA